MPYCPECRDEFQEWVKVCPDCGVTLVDTLPKPPVSKTKPKDKSGGDPLEHIATAPNEALAMMWAEILENEGMHCLTRSGNGRAAMYVSLLSRCEIHVLATQAKKAKQILAPFLEE